MSTATNQTTRAQAAKLQERIRALGVKPSGSSGVIAAYGESIAAIIDVTLLDALVAELERVNVELAAMRGREREARLALAASNEAEQRLRDALERIAAMHTPNSGQGPGVVWYGSSQTGTLAEAASLARAVLAERQPS